MVLHTNRSTQAQLAALPQRVKPPGKEEVVAAAAEATKGLDVRLTELRKAAKAAYDRVYYGDVLPPIGSFQISYARCEGAAVGQVLSAGCEVGS